MCVVLVVIGLGLFVAIKLPCCAHNCNCKAGIYNMLSLSGISLKVYIGAISGSGSPALFTGVLQIKYIFLSAFN